MMPYFSSIYIPNMSCRKKDPLTCHAERDMFGPVFHNVQAHSHQNFTTTLSSGLDDLTNSKRQGTVVYRDYLEGLVHTIAGIYHDTSVTIEVSVARKEGEPETGERWCPGHRQSAEGRMPVRV